MTETFITQQVGKNIMNETLKQIAIATLLIGVAGSIVMWSNANDKRVMEAADKYEECVKTKMHTTPSAYYNENGEYPTCQ